MNKTKITFLSVLFALLLVPCAAWSHCEVPCGIYGDKARIEAIEEHITTLEKSIKLIGELSGEDELNYNQIVRWVDNKETHAEEIQEIVYQYFMTQRIKPVPESETEAHAKYVKQLRLLHEMLVYAMKAKQSTDLKNIAKLRSLVKSFRGEYLGPEEGAHSH